QTSGGVYSGVSVMLASPCRSIGQPNGRGASAGCPIMVGMSCHAAAAVPPSASAVVGLTARSNLDSTGDAAWLAKARERHKNWWRFGAHSENLGHVYQSCRPRRRSVRLVSFQCSGVIRAVGIVVQPGRLDAPDPSVQCEWEIYDS